MTSRLRFRGLPDDKSGSVVTTEFLVLSSLGPSALAWATDDETSLNICCSIAGNFLSARHLAKVKTGMRSKRVRITCHVLGVRRMSSEPGEVPVMCLKSHRRMYSSEQW